MTPIDPTDHEYEEHVIEEVREEAGDYYELSFGRAMGIGCPKVPGLPAPQFGETLRLYGRGFGSTVRGIVINGRVYRYQTAAEADAAHEQWCLDREVQREREFTEQRDATDRRIAALPPLFQERIAKFQRDGGYAFRRDYEGYELFCCEQAVVIADALKTDEAVLAWAKLPYEQQKAAVPGLDDGHSGNTFGMAVRLAHWSLSHPENVVKEHGALVPLVGCEDYGCKHEPTADVP